MITDEMLAKAAAEVSAAVTESVPETAHRFSPEFEAKMDAVLHQKSQPAFGRGLRRAAAVALVILTAFGMLAVASPTAWAAMTDWVKDTYKTYVVYAIRDLIPPEVGRLYSLPQEVEGYRLLTETVNGKDRSFMYLHSEGRILRFDYLVGSDDAAMFLYGVEDYTQLDVALSGASAQVYLAPDPDDHSLIIWQHNGSLLCITMVGDADALTVMAELVRPAGE